MASSTSFPAPGSRSKKPLGKMADWLRQALSKKPKEKPVSQESTPSDAPQPSSPEVHSPPSLSSATSAVSPELPPSYEGATSNNSSGRWRRDYDVCVCHSEEDLAAAQELVAYLEGSSAGLRCFLQLRDAAPGGAIVSELCRALDSSHCRVLLITPGFLSDPWCRYQMLQALSQAPGAEGCTIPLLSGLARAAYPAELRFMYFVDGRGPDHGFRQVKDAVLRCKLCKEG
ncbi:Toll/interleukin-1 receptor domain-containing adapter protein [Pteropus alecto]|uniref:Toll/interleukin-1 receptor domain-containing adapter protein n=1 Tax=Pteropus alecto TaxID=9402 RepID=L5KDJ6_PTEAL|nr:Toll/interleukin-1 receptor domain-containing adapter protein [Pteropus alecto]